ncbi:MAG: flagellar hook-associated protein FlgK [Candidatus Desulforudis sp.]|nr:flagellar hook-associated protein FlgK [Desulforudis sp.]
MSFLGIEIARRSLLGHQRALTTTAHNIANINTPGYSRQEAVLQTTLAISYPSVFSPRPGQLGTGMHVTEIRRFRDAYLDRQVREANSAIGYWSGMETALQRVEAVLPEPTDFGIQALLGDFFSAWHYLAQDPDNPGSKAVVKGAAETLANSLSLAHYSITNIREDLDGLFDKHLERINSLGQQISELNWEIAYQRNAGANPNDLLDRRDYLLEELAKLADTTVTVPADLAHLQVVSVEVYGVELVDGTQYDETGFGFLTLERQDAEDAVKVDDETFKTRGELAATAAAAAKVEGYLEHLGRLMDDLAGAVNGVLGEGGVPATFFVYDDVAGQLSLDSDEADAVLAAITAEQAWAVAQLREQKVADGGEATLEGFYQRLVTGIGADLNTAQRGLDNVNAILGQIEALRESVSGVNLDEELTRMIQYQYGYQAAARVITVLDEMLDTLINRML